MKYFIAFLLPVEAEQRVRFIAEKTRDRFALRDPFQKSPPHITLKIPFTTFCNNKKQLDEFLKKFTLGRKAIPISLKRFGHFNIGVIYWDVIQKDETLETLKEELCMGLEEFSWVTFDPVEPKGIPHVKLCEGDIRGRFETIYDYVHEKYPQEVFIILKDIALFQKPFGTEQWEIVNTYTLK